MELISIFTVVCSSVILIALAQITGSATLSGIINSPKIIENPCNKGIAPGISQGPSLTTMKSDQVLANSTITKNIDAVIPSIPDNLALKLETLTHLSTTQKLASVFCVLVGSYFIYKTSSIFLDNFVLSKYEMLLQKHSRHLSETLRLNKNLVLFFPENHRIKIWALLDKMYPLLKLNSTEKLNIQFHILNTYHRNFPHVQLELSAIYFLQRQARELTPREFGNAMIILNLIENFSFANRINPTSTNGLTSTELYLYNCHLTDRIVDMRKLTLNIMAQRAFLPHPEVYLQNCARLQTPVNLFFLNTLLHNIPSNLVPTIEQYINHCDGEPNEDFINMLANYRGGGHQGGGDQGDGNQGGGHQGGGDRGDGNQGGGDQGDGNQGGGNQGGGHQGGGGQGDGNQGGGDPGDGDHLLGHQGDGNQGGGHQGDPAPLQAQPQIIFGYVDNSGVIHENLPVEFADNIARQLEAEETVNVARQLVAGASLPPIAEGIGEEEALALVAEEEAALALIAEGAQEEAEEAIVTVNQREQQEALPERGVLRFRQFFGLINNQLPHGVLDNVLMPVPMPELIQTPPLEVGEPPILAPLNEHNLVAFNEQNIAGININEYELPLPYEWLPGFVYNGGAVFQDLPIYLEGDIVQRLTEIQIEEQREANQALVPASITEGTEEEAALALIAEGEALIAEGAQGAEEEAALALIAEGEALIAEEAALALIDQGEALIAEEEAALALIDEGAEEEALAPVLPLQWFPNVVNNAGVILDNLPVGFADNLARQLVAEQEAALIDQAEAVLALSDEEEAALALSDEGAEEEALIGEGAEEEALAPVLPDQWFPNVENNAGVIHENLPIGLVDNVVHQLVVQEEAQIVGGEDLNAPPPPLPFGIPYYYY